MTIKKLKKWIDDYSVAGYDVNLPVCIYVIDDRSKTESVLEIDDIGLYRDRVYIIADINRHQINGD